MAIKPINVKSDKKPAKVVTAGKDSKKDSSVIKSFTLPKSLIQEMEDFKFSHRKDSYSQIVQEALALYFSHHGNRG